jgi:hypothetical protein
MLTLRIMVRPMKYAAFGVPFILPIELYGISLRDALGSWRQVDVVSDKECLTGIKPQDEALMHAPFSVIRKNANNYPLASDLNIGLAISVRRSDDVRSGGIRGLSLSVEAIVIEAGVCKREKDCDSEELAHDDAPAA